LGVGVGAVVSTGVTVEVLDGVGALRCGAWCNGGGAPGSVRPRTTAGILESTKGVGMRAAGVLPALALRTMKAAANASATISAVIATRPREVSVIRVGTSSALHGLHPAGSEAALELGEAAVVDLVFDVGARRVLGGDVDLQGDATLQHSSA
jgi:hypothetical protein